jgi:Holliday junction resolvasome RuvABC endonuclease subunit
MNILGLDISTSIIGACVLDEQFNIIKLTHIDFKKCKDFWEKVDFARDALSKIIDEYKIDKFCVEEILLNFSPGFSSAGTIITLAKFNAIVSMIVREKLNTNPIYISASHARKLCGLKMLSKAKSGGISYKEQVVKYLTEGCLKHIEFPKTKTGKYKPFVGDLCDSFVMAKAGMINNLS